MEEKTKQARMTAVVHAVLTAAVILVNALANALPINNLNTGEISDMYPNLFVPAGITFSIWGLIYLLVILWVVFQFRISSSRPEEVLRTSPWFIVLSVANILWIFFWHYLLPLLSLVIMFIFLFSLIKLYLSMGIGRESVPASVRFLHHLPISVYLGWISVATIANITAVLVHYQWGGFGLSEAFWTVFVMAAGILIGLAMLLKRRDPVHPLVVIWAYIGILIKRTAAEVQVTSVITTAWIGIVILGAAVLFFVLTRRSYLTMREH